ncbi:MAG: anthranilate synthase component II [Chitinophagales bacterium]
MILVIDNYDSFTYNLVQYIEESGQEVLVSLNDRLQLSEIEALKPSAIIISPGPSTPQEAGISLAVIKHFYRDIPILGVCLGHQAIANAFGGEVVINYRMMHGKVSPIHHDGLGIYQGVENPFSAARYHSLIVTENTLPSCLQISARSEAGEIMGIRHRSYPTEGVQFHPESIMTKAGKRLIMNFLQISENWNRNKKAEIILVQ